MSEICPYVKMHAQFAVELQQTVSISRSHVVRVLPFEDRWCVAVGQGHYAEPISKELAILRACAIARSMGELEIGVYDCGGLVERIASAHTW